MSYLTENNNWWFSKPGQEDDIVLSTRVRLVRNLDDFPFYRKMTEDDKIRVDSLIYDAFNDLEDYSFCNYDKLTESEKSILQDNNIAGKKCTSIILNKNDNSISGLTNESDHLKISCFEAGLNCESAARKIYNLDEKLQQKLQFAASLDFGYLTSNLCDCGSGLKISLRLLIPSIILAEKLEDVKDMLEKNQLSMTKVYSSQTLPKDSFANYIYDITTQNSLSGTELDQIASIKSNCMIILKMERKIRREFTDNNNTIILNFLRQKYFKALSSLLLTYEEACDVISAIKWGTSLNLINGLSQNDLNALYFLETPSHLNYLCSNYDFSFEEDIKQNRFLEIERLRAIVLHQLIDEK